MRRLACVAAGLVAVSLSAAPRARAQDTTRKQVAPPAAADTDSTARPSLPVNGLLLRAQHVRYEMTVVSPDSTHVVGMRDVDAQLSTYGAFPAWRIVETRSGAVASVDTLYASYTDLRPLHWSSTQGLSRLALEFTPDSIYGGTSGPSGDHTIMMANRGDLLAGAPMTELALQQIPLSVGRVDSVSVLVIDLGSSRILPATLSVDGEQDVTTGMGRAHCWVVTLNTALGVRRMWVAESDPVVVQTRQDIPGMPNSVLVERLVSRR